MIFLLLLQGNKKLVLLVKMELVMLMIILKLFVIRIKGKKKFMEKLNFFYNTLLLENIYLLIIEIVYIMIIIVEDVLLEDKEK